MSVVGDEVKELISFLKEELVKLSFFLFFFFFFDGRISKGKEDKEKETLELLEFNSGCSCVFKVRNSNCIGLKTDT